MVGGGLVGDGLWPVAGIRLAGADLSSQMATSRLLARCGYTPWPHISLLSNTTRI